MTTNAATLTLGSAVRTCTSCQSGLTSVAGVAGVEHASATVAAVFVPDTGPRQYDTTAASPALLLCATYTVCWNAPPRVLSTSVLPGSPSSGEIVAGSPGHGSPATR